MRNKTDRDLDIMTKAALRATVVKIMFPLKFDQLTAVKSMETLLQLGRCTVMARVIKPSKVRLYLDTA